MRPKISVLESQQLTELLFLISQGYNYAQKIHKKTGKEPSPIVQQLKKIYDKDKGYRVTQAKNAARHDFLAKLGQKFRKDNRYDADEGKVHIDEVTGYNEGWVYYVKR